MGPIRRKLDTFYWNLTRWITPGLVNAQRPYIALLDRYLQPGVKWLDLGCGRRLIPGWLPDADARQTRWVSRAGVAVGVDLDHESLKQNTTMPFRVMGYGGQLPFPDGYFDLISANMVVEHIEDPAATLTEVRRVLKPGGVFLFHTPNVLNPLTLMAIPLSQWLKSQLARILENRAEEDVFRTYYRMNREVTIRRLSAQAGMDIDRFDLLESSPETMMLGPLVVFEMLFIRLCRYTAWRSLRSNIITVLHKPVEAIHPSPIASHHSIEEPGDLSEAA